MQSMEQPPRPIDLRAIFWKAVRYRWVIAFPILAIGCAAFLYLKLTPSKYASDVIISLGDQVKVSAALEPLVKSNQGSDQSERMVALENRINSRPFLNEVANRLGMTRDPAVIQEATAAAHRLGTITPEEYALRSVVETLAGRIRLKGVQGTLVRLTANGLDPHSAMNLATTIANLLLEESQRATLAQAQARIEFSSEQSSVYEDRLHKSEAALESYQRSLIGRGLTTSEIAPDNVDRARSLLRDSDEEIEQIRSRIQSQRNESENRGEALGDMPILSSSTLSSLQSRLTQLEISYALASLRDKNEAGESSLKSQIGQVRQLLFQECQSLAQAMPGDYAAETRNAAAGNALDRAILRSLRDKRERLNQMLSSYARGLVDSPTQKIELERLQADVASNRELLLTLRKEASSSRISEALESSQPGLQITVAEPAQLPLRPAFPDRMKVMMAAGILGVFLSVGLVLGIERFGATIRSVEEAEKEYSTRVIGSIPRVAGWPRPGSFLVNHWPVMAMMFVMVATTVVYLARIVPHSNHPSRATQSGQQR